MFTSGSNVSRTGEYPVLWNLYRGYQKPGIGRGLGSERLLHLELEKAGV